MGEFRLDTQRLILREWHASDFDPFFAMSNDPRVMATLGPLMDETATRALIDQLKNHQAAEGFCAWAVERRADKQFLGWCGLLRGRIGPIDGKVEIGWRLAHDSWGQGYAREGAVASLAWAFANLPDDRIWAITTPRNVRSWGLMERLGMTREHNLDFDHPNIPLDSPLSAHITYSVARPV